MDHDLKCAKCGADCSIMVGLCALTGTNKYPCPECGTINTVED